MLDIKKLKYIEKKLYQSLCRQPTKKELSDQTKMSESRINELQAHILREPTGLNDLKQDEQFEDKHDD